MRLLKRLADHSDLNTPKGAKVALTRRAGLMTRSVSETRELVEGGFEYIVDMDDVKLLRKRKRGASEHAKSL